MNINELKEELSLAPTAFTDRQLEQFLEEGNNRAYNVKNWLGDLIACYEVCRRMGDSQGMQFYKFKILGKLEIITPKDML